MGFALAAVALTACGIPTAPAQPGGITPTGTALPAPSDTPAAAPTSPPDATETSAPTPPPGLPAVISKDNLSGLSEQSFGVPEPVERFIWPSPEAVLAQEPFEPRPDLLLQAGPNLHPILLNPFGLGMPVNLPLNGTQPLAFAPDGTSMVIKDPTRTALFRLDGPIIRELPQPAEAYGANYSRDGRYLVVTSASVLEATVYDLAADPVTPPVILSGFETAAPVYDVSIVPGGKTIAWHARATLQLQDVASGQMGARLSYEDFISNMSFAPDGSKLALAVAGSLYLYALPDGSELTKISLSAPPNSLDWSPDGLLLAAGYGQGLEIWDGASLAPLISLPGANDFTGLVGFSPDGRYLASTHDNNVFGVWSVK